MDVVEYTCNRIHNTVLILMFEVLKPLQLINIKTILFSILNKSNKYTEIISLFLLLGIWPKVILLTLIAYAYSKDEEFAFVR